MKGRDGNVRILEGSHRQQKITSLWQSGAVLFLELSFQPYFHYFYFDTGCLSHANAETRLARPVPDSQRLIIENNNLSADTFFTAYMSKNLMERRYAEMYLLGALDATEGRVWCDYQHFKTITLAEVLHSGLSKLDLKQRESRAAHVISDILGKEFPCKGGKK